MSMRLNICTRCHKSIRRIFNVPAQCRARLLSSQSRGFDSTDDSEFSPILGAEDNTNSEEQWSLSPRAERFYQDMKAFFPYGTPWRLTSQHIKRVNDAQAPSSRLKTLSVLNTIEQTHISNEMQDVERKARYQEYKARRKDEPYDCFGNIFLWTRNSTYKKWYNHKLCHAYMFGAPVIIDCSFEKEFSKSVKLMRQYKEQFVKLFNTNSLNAYPSKIILCNVAKDSPLRNLEFNAQVISAEGSFISIHTESYLELFHKRNLVYLSSDAPPQHVMHEYNKKTVYIIGGLGDMGGEFKKATFAKAREEKIRCEKFPLQKYATYRGNNILPMDKVLKILNLARQENMEVAVKKSMHLRIIHDVEELRQRSAVGEEKRQSYLSKMRRNSKL